MIKKKILDDIREANKPYTKAQAIAMLKVIELEYCESMWENWHQTEFVFAMDAMHVYSDQQCLERDERIKKLEEALTELVDLKQIKDDWEHTSNITDRDRSIYENYLERKPKAWEQARKVLKPNH